MVSYKWPQAKHKRPVLMMPNATCRIGHLGLFWLYLALYLVTGNAVVTVDTTNVEATIVGPES